ncbi:hypothetical protein EVAR_61369_1 [Eumeta japonica]|uniref:Uncharacterized protein n=1 Tax=Eumeta variegata TaxID=151549 RepID=A0A4C1Z7T1_EUMVA|nr:hypothetical protein EVAR_61369_1 [Eumeta japonica]
MHERIDEFHIRNMPCLDERCYDRYQKFMELDIKSHLAVVLFRSLRMCRERWAHSAGGGADCQSKQAAGGALFNLTFITQHGMRLTKRNHNAAILSKNSLPRLSVSRRATL